MASYGCTVEWKRGDVPFTDQKYSRAHAWRFDGGAQVPGSSSPHSVRVPLSDPAAVDPEEALVAAVSSCHMLWFLSLAAQRGFVVDSYRDAAEGRMGAFENGKRGIVEVLLRPAVLVGASGILPAEGEIDTLHHEAHEHCDIAHSIRGVVRVQGTWRRAPAA
jgi:organic hydroperoxide reductase OsmC/OhrA